LTLAKIPCRTRSFSSLMYMGSCSYPLGSITLQPTFNPLILL
jgi:hypothetical protein